MRGPRDQDTCACEHGGGKRRNLLPLHGLLLRFVASGLYTDYLIFLKDSAAITIATAITITTSVRNPIPMPGPSVPKTTRIARP
ncbi:hypothetical protein L810_5921 [Burkholderia sp. AU4i]|nr:hypothetical protein L810_5921 [Burkholderia sp. AU4i]MDW9234252.1 hypothetical protein [Burkholderia cepacia]